MEDIHCWEEKFKPCLYSDRLLNKVDSLNRLVKQPVDMTELKKSIYYARKYHGVQMRQSGEAYYSHPLEVAYMLAEYAANEDHKYYRTDILVTAILHDTIEDTRLTEGIILDIFGKKISTQVECLTRIKDKGNKISSTEIVEFLFREKKDGLLMIKLFDRLHNMQTIGAKSPEKIKKVLEETFKVFLIATAYLNHTYLENELSKLCLEKTFINTSSLHPVGFFEDNSLLLSLGFQNDLNQMQNLILREL